MFFHDINIGHTPLTMQYCTPGVRHLSIRVATQAKRGTQVCTLVFICMCPCVILFEGELGWGYEFGNSSVLFLL